MIRKILIATPLAFFIVAIANLIFGNLFNFTLWLFGTLLISFAVLPIVFNLDKRHTPVYQIFASMIVFIIFFAIAAYKDFIQLGLRTDEAFLYGTLSGIGIIAIAMIFKGAK